MSAYRYGGKETIQAELKRLALEKAQTRRQNTERRSMLQQLRRERARLEELEAEANHFDQEIAHLTATVHKLPPPMYGGEVGLLRAAAEAAAHDRKKRAA